MTYTKFPPLCSLQAVVLILLASGSALAQISRAEAETAPLSTAIYLLSNTDKGSHGLQKVCLAHSLSKAERFSDLEIAVSLLEPHNDADVIALIDGLISKGRSKEADRLLSSFIAGAGNDHYSLELALKPLLRLGRDTEAVKLVNSLSDQDKIDGIFSLAKLYIDRKLSDAALELLKDADTLALRSKYAEDKAELGLLYAKLGKGADALRFAELALRDLTWTSGKPEYTEGRVIDSVVQTYKTLGRQAEAGRLLARLGANQESHGPDVFQIENEYIAQGKKKEAVKLLEESLAARPEDSAYILEKLGEVHLSLGQTKKAETIARRMNVHVHAQQRLLRLIADRSIAHRNRSTAAKTLAFALERANAMDTSEEENGLLWTSAKMDQARYLAEIAARYAGMHADREAVQVISQIKKPYLRARTLADFVTMIKNRSSAGELAPYLDEAISLLSMEKAGIFDHSKFDALARVARVFAEIGMHDRSNDLFAEILLKLDREMIEEGAASGVLYGLCNIGVEFEGSKIKANDRLKNALSTIIANWENDEY